MTIEEMVRRLRTVRDNEVAMPLLTHEYAAIIAALRAGQQMNKELTPGNAILRTNGKTGGQQAWDAAVGENNE